MSFSPNSSIVNRTIDLKYAYKKRASSLKWIVVNIVLFLLLAYDLTYKCAGYTTALHWVELCCAGVLGANVVQHALRLARARGAAQRPAPGARSPLAPTAAAAGAGLPAPLSPARAWRTPDSPPPSPPSPASPASPESPRLERRAASDEFIADHRTLANYLRECESRARLAGAAEAWAPLLPSCSSPQHYQLASLDSERSPLEESGGAGVARGAALWRRLPLEPARLTQWNLNLRVWLHVTVLQRLVREMERIDAALAALGLGDARLGHVGVERLQKLPAAAALPSLAALLPYLEPFADQRYVVQRVRELAHGGCLSDYRWSGGGSEWDDGKPTDAELVLQLLAAYLDGQLPPAPAARPFSAAHLSAAPGAAPRGPAALAIHRVSARPPHYVLVRGAETVEVARGRNNLLHTVLLFIAAAARADPPALQRLHLGPAGLNMLWIIGR